MIMDNNFKSIPFMPPIRKQPKRKTKKIKIPSFRNPFQASLPYLPVSIAHNLESVDRIVLRNIHELIPESVEPPSSNIQFMKEAITQQQEKINLLKRSSQNEIANNVQHDEKEDKEIEIGEQEKKEEEKVQCEAQMDNVGWILQQNGEINFFE